MRPVARATLPALLALLPFAAAAQDGPSFDCAKASTQVESAICADWTLSAFDRWVGQLYKGMAEWVDRGTLDQVKQGQRAWLKDERNACASAKSQDPSVPDSAAVWSCLYDAYETRAIELAQILEPAIHGDPGPEGPWSGSYSFDDGNASGSMLLLAMPDARFTIELSSVAGRSAHVCDLSTGGGNTIGLTLRFEMTETPGCWILLERLEDGNGSLALDSDGCQDYCGANGYFTGDYRAVRPAD
jgi:uncharacterized protein